MSNLAGKAYGMNVVTPSKPRWTFLNNLIFMVSRALPARLGGLLGLSIIHFARWTIVKCDEWPDLGQGQQNLAYDYMIFNSNFNGTWDQYIDAFSDGIPSGLDFFWYSALKYPASIPISPFKQYITHNQIQTDYYYNATPGSAQRDIKCAFAVYDAVLKLQKMHGDSSPEEFARAYRDALLRIQGCFGEPGYGPIASLDTEYADVNREAFVKKAAQVLKARNELATE
ncbi:hypothetical protein [Fulvimarina sp. MAC8]|uniref:hypothetical protein n=1 Tax=Fulvimarina sp. MAC8 TaxID=3162874 RepID=UPI0032ED8764